MGCDGQTDRQEQKFSNRGTVRAKKKKSEHEHDSLKIGQIFFHESIIKNSGLDKMDGCERERTCLHVCQSHTMEMTCVCRCVRYLTSTYGSTIVRTVHYV